MSVFWRAFPCCWLTALNRGFLTIVQFWKILKRERKKKISGSYCCYLLCFIRLLTRSFHGPVHYSRNRVLRKWNLMIHIKSLLTKARKIYAGGGHSPGR